MSGQNTTHRFIHELRLKVTSGDFSVLEKRLNSAHQVYNACLGEDLKRLKLMRESKDWQAACKMPKKVKNDKGRAMNNTARQALFKVARPEYFINFSVEKI